MAAARLFLRLLACSAAIASTGQAEPWTATRFAWEPVAGAAYYEGTLALPSGPSRVRTTSRWLLLQGVDRLSLDAFRADGARIDAVTPTKTVYAPPPSPQPAPAPAEASAEAEDPFAFDDLTDRAYGDVETPESELALPAHELDDEPEPAPEVARGPGQADPFGSRVGLAVGLGKERLTATGGVSEYVGDAGIGGTTVRGERRLGTALFGAAQIGAHNFATTVAQTDESSGAVVQTESKFLRLAARAVVFYDFNPWTPVSSPSYTLGVGLGLAYFRLPMLQIHDAATGVADLELAQTLGLGVGAYYARYLTPMHTLSAELTVTPLVFKEDAKGMSTNVFLSWRYAFVAGLYTEIALQSVRESLAVQVDCPIVSGCESSSAAASNATSARAGIGLVW